MKVEEYRWKTYPDGEVYAYESEISIGSENVIGNENGNENENEIWVYLSRVPVVVEEKNL